MIRFIIFGILGVFGEVLTGAIKDSISSRAARWEGRASIALFPIWGLIAFLYPALAIHIGQLPWYGRGAVIMLAFFAAQLILGIALEKAKHPLWHYSGNTSFLGIIRLEDAPVWFIAGLILERAYPMVKAAAGALSF